MHAEHQLLWEQTTDDRVELEEDARKGMDKPVRVSEKLINAQYYSNASEQAGRKSTSTARKLYNKPGRVLDAYQEQIRWRKGDKSISEWVLAGSLYGSWLATYLGKVW